MLILKRAVEEVIYLGLPSLGRIEIQLVTTPHISAGTRWTSNTG
jgi:hypothetical protein